MTRALIGIPIYSISGMVFGWGDNSKGQSSPKYGLAVCPMPQAIILPTEETASDISASENQSFILTDIGHVYTFGSNIESSEEQKLRKLDLEDFEEGVTGIRKIFSTQNSLLGNAVLWGSFFLDFHIPCLNVFKNRSGIHFTTKRALMK